MSKLRVGDWVTHINLKFLDKIVRAKRERKIDSYGRYYYVNFISFGKEENDTWYSDGGYYRATVLDYIRALDAEQIVNIFHSVGYHIGCSCCMGCLGGYTCRERRVQWLNQPLTDEIVEHLGGIEE